MNRIRAILEDTDHVRDPRQPADYVNVYKAGNRDVEQRVENYRRLPAPLRAFSYSHAGGQSIRSQWERVLLSPGDPNASHRREELFSRCIVLCDETPGPLPGLI